MEKSYPLTVAGAVADSALAFAQSLTAFPCCRSFDRRTWTLPWWLPRSRCQCGRKSCWF